MTLTQKGRNMLVDGKRTGQAFQIGKRGILQDPTEAWIDENTELDEGSHTRQRHSEKTVKGAVYERGREINSQRPDMSG
jgi:hypothetical protein